MAKFEFGIGKIFESLTKNELDDSLSAFRRQATDDQLAAARGRKYMRTTITGQAAGGVLQMGGDFPNAGPAGTIGPSPQPRAGYAWAMRRMSVSGLTVGSTPDVVNLHRVTPGTVAATSSGIWQFNGNNYAYTFSHEQLVFLEGETPVLVSVGTFAATGRIALSADFIEVPQVELVKAR